ncbi:MAG: hypothetical protein V2L15_02245 [Desulfobacteraceae bacterium]|jgi:hypothetical protein|nr:hypothetical protein [Desulfobacteraceae bacterium]
MIEMAVCVKLAFWIFNFLKQGVCYSFHAASDGWSVETDMPKKTGMRRPQSGGKCHEIS